MKGIDVQIQPEEKEKPIKAFICYNLKSTDSGKEPLMLIHSTLAQDKASVSYMEPDSIQEQDLKSYLA